MRIAIDIDSTLHDYWAVLSEAARERFGVELPYEEQFTWGITRLKPEQLACCVKETHCAKTILGAKPYPGAVDAVNAWHEAGHFIHVTSHRVPEATDATAEWLERIGLAYDDLWCSDDKLARVRELDIELLIDDAPQTLRAAVEQGIRCATLLHPWNEDVVAEEALVAAEDWPGLAAALADALPALRCAAPAA